MWINWLATILCITAGISFFFSTTICCWYIANIVRNSKFDCNSWMFDEVIFYDGGFE